MSSEQDPHTTRYLSSPLARRFVTFIVDRPLRALLAAVLLLAAAVPGAASLKEDFSFRVWFEADDPLLARFDAFEAKFGNDDAAIVAVHSPSGIFDRDSGKLLTELSDALWKVPRIIRVTSLSNYQWVHADGDDILIEDLIPGDRPLTPELLAERQKVALGHELLPDYLVSRDGRTALVFARVAPSFAKSEDYADVVTGIRDTVAGFAGRGDHEFYLNGSPVLMQTFREVAFGDLGLVMPILLALVMIILGLIFRGPAGIALPLVVVGASIAGALGVGGYSGISLNNMTAILPHILIAIALADTVHILVGYAHFRRAGLPGRQAVRASLEKNFRPTVLTSLTTSAALFSFASAKVAPVAQLGILGGIGTVLAWLFTYLVVGAALSLLEVRVHTGRPVTRTDRSGVWAGALLFRWRWPVVAGFLGLTILATALTVRNRVSSDPFEYFAPDVPLKISTEFMEAEVGAASPIELVIDSGQEEGIKDPAFVGKVERLDQWLKTRDEVRTTVSVVDIFKQMNRSLHSEDPEAYRLPETREALAQLLLLYTMGLPQGMDINDQVSVKNDAIRMTVMWTERESTRALQAFREIEAQGKRLGLDVQVTGKFPLMSAMQPYTVNSLVVSVATALLAVSLILVLALRSLVLGLLALLANLLPLIVGGAALQILGYPLDVGTAMTASVALGICVDDSIHFLANYEAYRREGASPQTAVARVFSGTGRALVVTTIILSGAFATFGLGSFLPNVHFGVIVALMLAVALVGDLVLLPALLLLRRQPGVSRVSHGLPAAVDASAE